MKPNNTQLNEYNRRIDKRMTEEREKGPRVRGNVFCDDCKYYKHDGGTLSGVDHVCSHPNTNNVKYRNNAVKATKYYPPCDNIKTNGWNDCKLYEKKYNFFQFIKDFLAF